MDISETSHKALLSLSLEKANQAFATLRQNETLWREELAERQAWDQTVADGIEE
jgi:hypothetical protein